MVPDFIVPHEEREPYTIPWKGVDGSKEKENHKSVKKEKNGVWLGLLNDTTTRDQVNKMFKDSVMPGGHYKPPNCQARSRVAFLIPYRVVFEQIENKNFDEGREKQLTLFLKYMIPWLQNQEIEFKFYIIFQGWSDPAFNRAKLLSIGYLEAEKDGPWDCYTTHDIDRLPFNPNITYHCPPHSKTYRAVGMTEIGVNWTFLSCFGRF